MIGNKIAEGRKSLNLSQAQLAERLSISPQAVGKWERGESLPDLITFSRLGEILGVDLNYFIGKSQPFVGDEQLAATITPTNISKIAQELLENDLPHPSERHLLTNFNGSNLPQSDFAGVTVHNSRFSGSALDGSDFSGVTAHNSRFNGSALQGTDFSGADLTGSSFRASDARNTHFDRANLTDCVLAASDFSGASFNATTLVRTEISTTALDGATFSDVQLIDVKLSMIEFKGTTFMNCVFKDVDFKYSDLSGACFDGQTFTGVRFDKTALNGATFKGATLKNVSFRSSFALTNKYYRSIKTISFDGALMDKLTYAALKGLGADLLGVTVV